MKKIELSSKIRHFVKSSLSPKMEDIEFVSSIYKSFNDLLGNSNCIQIGSFPRYTAVKPLHDLDILYVIGDWKEKNEVPVELLNRLAEKFKQEYRNPTRYNIKICIQTHSVSFSYVDVFNDEIFSVDLVPALKKGKNEFDRDMFYVPEIIEKRHGLQRQILYEEMRRDHKDLHWIKTDPLGYIEVASKLNRASKDFRLAVKFVKGWKNSCKRINDEFKLKSFHLEQIITNKFAKNQEMDVFDLIFDVLSNLKISIRNPCIPDRADSSKMIDSYVRELNETQIELVHNAVDAVLIAFENINSEVDFNTILASGYYKRCGVSESFLFDQKIPMLIDESFEFKADGYVKNINGFRDYRASLKRVNGVVDTKNKIEFAVVNNDTNGDIIKWKVKNDNRCLEKRGEITDYHTLHNPESTAYYGNHFAECYSIKNGTCIAKDIVHVVVNK